MRLMIFNKIQGWVKCILPLFLFTFLPLSAGAVTKAAADEAYRQEK